MSLLELAENDLALTLESSEDFGKSISLTDPSGNSAVLTGQYGDISQLIILEDDTMPVSSNVAHISLRISSVIAAGLDYPETQQLSTDDPWQITVINVKGDVKTYKLHMTMPDLTLGVVTALVGDLIP